MQEQPATLLTHALNHVAARNLQAAVPQLEKCMKLTPDEPDLHLYRQQKTTALPFLES